MELQLQSYIKNENDDYRNDSDGAEIYVDVYDIENSQKIRTVRYNM